MLMERQMFNIYDENIKRWAIWFQKVLFLKISIQRILQEYQNVLYAVSGYVGLGKWHFCGVVCSFKYFYNINKFCKNIVLSWDVSSWWKNRKDIKLEISDLGFIPALVSLNLSFFMVNYMSHKSMPKWWIHMEHSNENDSFLFLGFQQCLREIFISPFFWWGS